MARAITGGPHDRPAIGVELARLLAAFPMAQPGASADLRVDAYAEALAGLPSWALREARWRIVRGEATVTVGDETRPLDMRFAPTPPQLASIVRDIVKPYRDDLADLTDLVRIEPNRDPDPAERKRVSDGFDALLDSLGRPAPGAAAQRARDRLAERARAMGLDEGVIDLLPSAPSPSGQIGETIRKAVNV